MLQVNRFVTLAALAALFLAGCGKPPPPPPPSNADGLKELAEVYKYRVYAQLPAPARLADLAEHWDAIQNAYPRIESGEYLVVWGVPLQEGSAGAGRVIAYEKKTPAEGGAVLLGDGTVKEMTADEFQAIFKG